MSEQTKREPSERKGILDKGFVYTNSQNTNILETFKRFGWEPPSCKKVK